MPVSLFLCTAILLAFIASVVTYLLTRLHMEKMSNQQAQALAEAKAALANERRVFQETAKAVEENARRKALDEFLADMRVEERHYVRQNRFLFANRKSLVMQERIFFRNIPLSNWVEHEVPVEEGASLDAVAKTFSVFSALEEGHTSRRIRLPF
jgi:hypothetical protein